MKKPTASKYDDVNYPQHYNKGGIEPPLLIYVI